MIRASKNSLLHQRRSKLLSDFAVRQCKTRADYGTQAGGGGGGGGVGVGVGSGVPGFGTVFCVIHEM
jgi:hypothetical protein